MMTTMRNIFVSVLTIGLIILIITVIFIVVQTKVCFSELYQAKWYIHSGIWVGAILSIIGAICYYVNKKLK